MSKSNDYKADDIKEFYIDLDNISTKEKNYLTHNFHPYPAKYIPQIPRKILDYLCLSANSVVLDPFCGSGTTLVESNIRGFNAVGSDSNPIACLVSKVKTTKLSDTSIKYIQNAVTRIEEYNMNIPQYISESIPQFLNRDHWFQKNMLLELTYIKHIIDSTEDKDARDFLYVAFSAILVKTSNQESDTRWVAKNKNLQDGFAFKEYLKKVNNMVDRIREFNLLSKATSRVYNADSRNLNFLEDNSIDCAITSPPYLNSYDYYLYHKLRMFWLGFNHHKVQEDEIGSRNKHCDNNQETSVYFDSIGSVAREVKRVMKNKGYFCVVIGDSIFKNELIEMDTEYTKLLESLEFSIVDKFSFNQRKYTKAFTPNTKTQDKKSHIILFQLNKTT